MRRSLGAAARTVLTLFDDGCPDDFHDLTKPYLTDTNSRGDRLSHQWCRICGLNVTKVIRAGDQ